MRRPPLTLVAVLLASFEACGGRSAMELDDDSWHQRSAGGEASPNGGRSSRASDVAAPGANGGVLGISGGGGGATSRAGTGDAAFGGDARGGGVSVASGGETSRAAAGDEAGDSHAGAGGEGGASEGDAGAGAFIPPSCRGLAARCRDESCCTTLNIDAAPLGYTQAGVATKVQAFALDKYEVTVGRFERFLQAYDRWHGVEQHPFVGEGAGEPATGWNDTWETGPLSSGALPIDSATLRTSLNCGGAAEYATVTRDNPLLPQNCVNWYVAFAFCIWDGGRLPTPAESEYAASGGDLHFDYPWGDSPAPDGGDASHALFGCLGDTDPTCSGADILEVGSRPLGRGRWGQLDLVGSMAEWIWDWQPYAAVDIHMGTSPVQRGSWLMAPQFLSPFDLNRTYSSLRDTSWGVRCARQTQ